MNIVDIRVTISLPDEDVEKLGQEQRFSFPRVRAMFTERVLRNVIVKSGVAMPAKWDIKVEPITPYPTLHRLLMAICFDNDMSMAPILDWPPECVSLEAKAKYLTLDDLELLATGEATEVAELVERMNIGDLNDFLNEAFDGKYSKNFFV